VTNDDIVVVIGDLDDPVVAVGKTEIERQLGGHRRVVRDGARRDALHGTLQVAFVALVDDQQLARGLELVFGGRARAAALARARQLGDLEPLALHAR
jgi:hypothetical protein